MCFTHFMLIGYMRVSTTDQNTDLQRDALIAAGVDPDRIYLDKASGKQVDRPGLAECLRNLRPGDTLHVWKLDRLGRSLRHLVEIIQDLAARDIGLKVLTGQGANIDTCTAAGKLVFGIFAALAEFERELISERTRAGLAAAKARGRKGGGKPKLSATTIAGVRARLAADPLLDKAGRWPKSWASTARRSGGRWSGCHEGLSGAHRPRGQSGAVLRRAGDAEPVRRMDRGA